MKTGISVWAFDPQRPLPEVFRMAREAGFDAVEVAIAEDGPITPVSTEADCRRIAAQATEAGVEIAGLASGLGWQYPITAQDAAIREKGIEAVAASLRVARWLGTDTILLVPGGVGAEFIPGFPVTPYNVAYENALLGLKKLAPIAAENRVTIGVENVWNKFLLSPLELRGLLDTVGSPYVGSYFDMGNVILTGYPEQWPAILGGRIKRVHAKDFKRAVATLDGFCPLGEGDVNFPAVMAALRAIGYDSYVTAEFFHCEQDLPAIAKSLREIVGTNGGAA